MQPDAYIPLYGSDFFEAMKPHGEKVGWPYLKAIWHYWKHTHCKGLPDNSEALRRICEVEKENWDEICSVIFDNDKCFSQDATTGLWHQKRAALEWQKSVAKYQSAVNAAHASWKNRPRKKKP